VTVDLDKQSVGVVGQEWSMHFEIDPFLKHCLMNGLDDIGLTMQHADAISAFETRRPAFYPAANN
jgi:3-isopropylmalate/(R)-2-methylmalate dehydratase small subunit